MKNIYRYVGKHFRLHDPVIFFVTVATIVGLLFIILVPPFQVPDEENHFYKAYSLSEFNIVQDNLSNGQSGAHLPSGLKEYAGVIDRNDMRTNTEAQYTKDVMKDSLRVHVGSTRIEMPFINLASYSPIAYIPQTIGIWISHLFTDRVAVLFYAARLANLVAYILIGYIVIRFALYARWLMVGVLVSPMALFLAGSLSADVSVIMYTALFAVLVTRLFKKGAEKLSFSDYALLGLVSVLLSLSKQAYIVLLPLMLLGVVDWKRTKKIWHIKLIRGRILPIMTIIVISALSLGIWMYATRGVISDVSILPRLAGLPVDPAYQKTMLLHGPVNAVIVVINSIFTGISSGVLTSMFGTFGWMNIYLPLWAIVLFIIYLFLLGGYESPISPAMKVAQRKIYMLLSGMLSFVCYSGVVIGLFIVWTPMHTPDVLGLQGRYFIPLLLLMAPAMVGWYTHTIKLRYIQTLLLISYVAVMCTLVSRYYGIFSLALLN